MKIYWAILLGANLFLLILFLSLGDTLEDDWLERLTTPSPRMLSEEDDGVWPNPNDDWDYVRDGRDSAEAFS